MRLTLLKSKLHRATVTAADLNYEGSIALAPELRKAAGLLLHERVEIYNINNGQRFATYVIGSKKKGEVMVLLGSFAAARSDSILIKGGFATTGQIYTLAVISCFGVVLTAGYMLWTIQRVYLGPEKPEYKGFSEIDSRELSVLTPLAVMAIMLGILPTVFVFAFTNQTVAAMFKLFS